MNWIKTDELGINGSISWTCRIQNISKNQNLYLRQSQITLFTLPWDTLYIFSCTYEVEIPAGAKLYINFYDVNIKQDNDSFQIEIHRGIKNWTVSGKIVNRLEIYGPFDTKTKCLIKIFLLSTYNSGYRFGLYARQMLLPLGICGNINLL